MSKRKKSRAIIDSDSSSGDSGSDLEEVHLLYFSVLPTNTIANWQCGAMQYIM